LSELDLDGGLLKIRVKTISEKGKINVPHKKYKERMHYGSKITMFPLHRISRSLFFIAFIPSSKVSLGW